MDLFNILNKPPPAGDGEQEAIKQPPNAPELTEEQRLQLVQFMEELKHQRTNDPAAFQKTMESLGLGSSDGSVGSAGDQMGGNLSELASAIGDLRTVGSAAPSISVNLPGGKSVLGKGGVENKQQKGITITPEPGFAIKTKVIPSGTKVFINLCTHEEIDAPSVKKKLNDKGESVEGMNVPLSVGPQYREFDKEGVDCLVYDIIVNAKVIQESDDDLTGQYRDFLCHLSIQSVEQKYPTHGQLNRQYKLPKLKYMGAIIKSQYIRDKKSTPQIQEVGESTAKPIPLKVNKVNKVEEYVELDKDLPFRLVWIKNEEQSAQLTQLESGGNSKENSNDYDNKENNSENNHSNNSQNLFITSTQFESPVTFTGTNNGTEYSEPIIVPDGDVDSLALFVDFPGTIDRSKIEVKVSPFKFQIKIPGYKQLLLYLPCAVLPVRSSSSLMRPEGYVNRIEFCLRSDVDTCDWGDKYDVGSKPWLVARALSEGESNDCDSVYGEVTSAARTEVVSTVGNDEYAEDKFHIRLPSNVDQYTGVSRDEDVEVEELPEDRFHKKDAASSYLINQREQAVKDKWAKHEKEKLERQNDPDSNIEYVDVDDYKPGGKYGVPEQLTQAEVDQVAVREELRRAAGVVASSLKDSEIGNLLSSSLWTELLD